ncbi:microtubule-associated proteins 1A/1B light chain 3C isoform X1 [Tupaia chinensis]|uniref:microtubule-associated proteins 1A/1B light chain 3C isoform X1 n=1 Tax=Tupaia chinensis TaxID=246437 RepID=UPI000FFC521C|nr:microtubule-associated proteins 1A/1B light chain 3C isoform X1 [Tupaia chinensis]
MPPPQKIPSLRPFKQRKSLGKVLSIASGLLEKEREDGAFSLWTYSFAFEIFTATRQEEVAGIRAKFPNKIPVIVERYPRERFLPLLDKTKFLVPQELTMTQFLSIIRSRMVLRATEAFYLLVNNKSLISMSVTMAEIYRDYKDEDGFLYMTYASQEMFGSPGSATPQ